MFCADESPAHMRNVRLEKKLRIPLVPIGVRAHRSRGEYFSEFVDIPSRKSFPVNLILG